MVKSDRVLAISLVLGLWALVSVDTLKAEQATQAFRNSDTRSRVNDNDDNTVSNGIIDRISEDRINLVGFKPQRTIDCEGSAVQITGNNGTITLQGTCREVVLVGNENAVQVEAVGAISVTGNRNQITWVSSLNGASPQVSQSGNDNAIAQVEISQVK